MVKCSICDNDAVYKIKDLSIYYCEKHAKDFFEKNSLEQIDKLKIGTKESNILKKYLLD